MLTKAELLLAADAAERWPWQRVKCSENTMFDYSYTPGDDPIAGGLRCGCPAKVVVCLRGSAWITNGHYGIYDELGAVYPRFIEAIDAGRGREVAQKFREAAEKVSG